jgi:hypothetical protein
MLIPLNDGDELFGDELFEGHRHLLRGSLLSLSRGKRKRKVTRGRGGPFLLRTSSASESRDNGNNRGGDRLSFRRPACGHKRSSNQRK